MATRHRPVIKSFYIINCKLIFNLNLISGTISKYQITILKKENYLKFLILNSADGDYHITTKTKATIHYNGKIVWEPPMIYKSYCAINIVIFKTYNLA